MSPRPRTVADADILFAAQRVMARLGPIRLTLAAVATEAGLSAATLVQRFGSKRGLMQALWAAALDGADDCFELLRPAYSSPLAMVRAAATEMARHTASPEEMANSLAFLQIDISDPEFHPYMLEMSRKMEAGYRKLIDEAIASGELVRCDSARLARAIGAISGGSLIGWAVFREGRAEAWVEADLDVLLEPYCVKPARKSRRRRRPISRRSTSRPSSRRS